MNRRTFTLLLTAAFGFFATPAWAGGKAGEVARVSFHIETDSNDNPKMLFGATVAGQQRAFRRLPEVSQKDIQSFAIFPAADGTTGMLFTLKDGANTRLAAITASNPNRWLLAMVNGRPVDAVLIDGQITDGKLVVWKGVTALDVQSFDKLIPRTGEKKKRG